MAKTGDKNSKPKVEVLILNTFDLTASQYKKNVEEMSIELFNIHTSIVAAIEEFTRLTNMNRELELKNGKLMLILVSLESLKQDNVYLK